MLYKLQHIKAIWKQLQKKCGSQNVDFAQDFGMSFLKVHGFLGA